MAQRLMRPGERRTAPPPSAGRRLRHRIGVFLHQVPAARLALLLGPVLLWMIVIYLGSLALLFLTSFWRQDPVTGAIVQDWGLTNYQCLVGESVYRIIAIRTVGIAVAVTVSDIALAIPIAYYAARIASPRVRTLLLLSMVLPLWSSYLVRVYAWRTILSGDGVLNWSLHQLHLGSVNLGFSRWSLWIVFSYLWLPYVTLPVYAALDRIPYSFIMSLPLVVAMLLTTFVLAFLYVPLFIIILYAFNPARSQSWPLPGLSTRWFVATWNNADVRTALLTSLKAGLGATTIALILGSLAAFAVHRFRFFGREAVSFVLILPLALPGLVTGMALNSTITLRGELIGLSFSLWTIIIGHATFCVVVVYNNVIARLRRTATSLVEASYDLGADGLQTFRYVILPNIASALIAGALLAFALSFDEIIVTNFTSGSEITLPKWIFNNLRLPNQRPVVNVVASVLLLVSLIPVYIAQRLTQESGGLVSGRGAVVPANEDAVEQAAVP